MSKVAIYCRLSEEDRMKVNKTDESNSIQNQKAMLLQYSIAQGWEVFSVYSDDNYTGSDRNRPEFNRMLIDAEAKKFDIILCKSQSRFTREMELVERYIHGLFPVWGIRFVSIIDNADSSNQGNKKSRQINGLVNEWMLEDMSQSIKSVLNSRREMGMHIGSFALYGYKKDPVKKGHLIIDDEAAAVVREVFTLFSLGYGKTAIAKILNDRGIPNPTEYKRLQGLRYQQPKDKNRTLWKYFAISNMLTNEMYIGNMVQGKYGSVSYKSKINKPRPKEFWYRKEGTHEAIIDRDLWDRVQIMIQERTKPFKGGTIGLFARKVRCASCGCVMRSSKNRDKYYLQCSTRHVSPAACQGAFISVDKLEQLVIQELSVLIDCYLDKEELERNIEFCDIVPAQIRKIAKNMAVYRKKADEQAKCLRELYLDKVRGILPENEFIMISKEFSDEKERFDQLAVKCQKKIKMLNAQLDSDRERCSLAEQYLSPKHLNREMVDILIDYITVGKKCSNIGEVSVVIYWNF